VRAIQYREHGGYDRLRAVELSAPEPDNGQALVRVTYAGVSPLDDTIRAGRMSSALHKPLPLIPGVGGTGVVVGETGLAEGTRVLVAGLGLGVSRDGAWREYLAAAPGDLIPIPDRVSDRQAGALDTGVGHLTAYLTLTELIDFQPGQSVFAPAVGGAVGMGSMQVARELGASLAISATSRPDKAERARLAGFDNVIDLSRESLSDGVARLTGGKGVDVVIDGVAGPLAGQAIASLARGGQYVSVGYSGGTTATIEVTDLTWKAARAYGFMVGLFTPETIHAARLTLLDWLADGRLNPVVSQEFPLKAAAEAQRFLIDDRPFGRVLLAIGEGRTGQQRMLSTQTWPTTTIHNSSRQGAASCLPQNSPPCPDLNSCAGSRRNSPPTSPRSADCWACGSTKWRRAVSSAHWTPGRTSPIPSAPSTAASPRRCWTR
jgi:NADPH:quinone reductase-like Zn-dependent oxidoreductase